MDWPEAARVSGVEVATLQLRFSVSAPARKAPKLPPAQVDEFKLWKLLQAERNTAAGLAMWLGWQLGLQAQEIIALTWEQVDFQEGVLRLPGRSVAMTSALRRILEEELLRRSPEEDPHVLLTEQSRKPLDLPRLSRLTRAALIRGGLERVTLRDLRRDDCRDVEDERILQRALEQGFVSRGDVSEVLGLSKTATYARLRRLTEHGRLVRVGGKYYLPGTVVPPEKHREGHSGVSGRGGLCLPAGHRGPSPHSAEAVHAGAPPHGGGGGAGSAGTEIFSPGAGETESGMTPAETGGRGGVFRQRDLPPGPLLSGKNWVALLPSGKSPKVIVWRFSVRLKGRKKPCQAVFFLLDCICGRRVEGANSRLDVGRG